MPRAHGYAPLDVSDQSMTLVREIRARAAATGLGHAAVFDLDGCLFDTRPRQVHILRALASREGLWPLYRVQVEHFRDWSLRTTFAHAGLDATWIEQHYDRIRAWWEQTFFASEYMRYDHAMPGAADLVRDVAAAGCHVVYLTGRDEGMRPGTEEALREAGFPLSEVATLLVKPNFEMNDTVFKESAMEAIAVLGRVVLFMDNEPANVNLFHRRHPEALVVFVETDHSPRPEEPDPAIPWLRSFLDAPL